MIDKRDRHLLTLNYGETASGISFPYAGIEIERGTAENYLFVYDETDDNFQVGVSGSLQPVATREDTPVDTAFAYWNASEYKFNTSSSYTIDTIATKTYVSTISGSLSDAITTASGLLQDYIDATASGLQEDIVATSGTLQDQIDNLDFSDIEWNVPVASGTYQGITSTATVSGNSLGFGNALYLKSDGFYYDAYATISGQAPCHAMALASGTGSKKILRQGYIRNDAWNFTPGYPIYLSTTSGSITQTAVSGTGQIVQILGHAETGTTIWFNPNIALGTVK